MEDSFPLSWPAGVARTPPSRRKRANFTTARNSIDGGYGKYRPITIAEARDRLLAELGRMGVREVVISTNAKVTKDGLPFSKQAEPADPGAAVYFELYKERRCVPSDRWDRVADNLAGIAAAIGALRGLERWVNDANVRAAFRGFAALPDPNSINWRSVLGFKSDEEVVPASIIARHRERAFERHPDRGGTEEDMSQLNRAKDQALAEIRQ